MLDLEYLTARIIAKAIQNNIGTEEQLTIRNIISYLDFEILYGNDEIVYKTRKDDNEKVMLIYQISYAPKNANPDAAQNIRRPHSFTVRRNGNLVYSIQSIKEVNQVFNPLVERNKNDNLEIEILGYDGTAEIYLFGLVAEKLGVNMNN